MCKKNDRAFFFQEARAFHRGQVLKPDRQAGSLTVVFQPVNENLFVYPVQAVSQKTHAEHEQ